MDGRSVLKKGENCKPLNSSSSMAKCLYGVAHISIIYPSGDSSPGATAVTVPQAATVPQVATAPQPQAAIVPQVVTAPQAAPSEETPKFETAKALTDFFSADESEQTTVFTERLSQALLVLSPARQLANSNSACARSSRLCREQHPAPPTPKSRANAHLHNLKSNLQECVLGWRREIPN